MYKVHVTLMFRTCNTGVYLQIYYMCSSTCAIQVYTLHMHYMCRSTYVMCIFYTCIICVEHVYTCVSVTHVVHMHIYTCNTPKLSVFVTVM